MCRAGVTRVDEPKLLRMKLQPGILPFLILGLGRNTMAYAGTMTLYRDLPSTKYRLTSEDPWKAGCTAVGHASCWRRGHLHSDQGVLYAAAHLAGVAWPHTQRLVRHQFRATRLNGGITTRNAHASEGIRSTGSLKP